MTDAAKAISDVLEYFETGKRAEWMGKTQDPMEREHGKVVNTWQDAYHNCKEYEDGYIDRDYIGD